MYKNVPIFEVSREAPVGPPLLWIHLHPKQTCAVLRPKIKSSSSKETATRCSVVRVREDEEQETTTTRFHNEV
jgi:hypothetical protein